MKRREFTLIELLVVIAIIGILAGMLLPSLHTARESARTASCMSNLKNVAAAKQSYAADNDDFFVPYTSKGTLWGSAQGTVWPAFARYLGMPDYCGEYDFAIIEDFLCPSAKGRVRDLYYDINGIRHYNMIPSYLMNGLGGGTGMDSGGPRAADGGSGDTIYKTGQRMSQIRNPSRLIDWMDGTGPWCGNIYLSDCTLYETYQKTEDETTGERVVAYRHNNSANAAFFDGHVEKKHWRDIEFNGSFSDKAMVHWLNREP